MGEILDILFKILIAIILFLSTFKWSRRIAGTSFLLLRRVWDGPFWVEGGKRDTVYTTAEFQMSKSFQIYAGPTPHPDHFQILGNNKWMIQCYQSVPLGANNPIT